MEHHDVMSVVNDVQDPEQPAAFQVQGDEGTSNIVDVVIKQENTCEEFDEYQESLIDANSVLSVEIENPDECEAIDGSHQDDSSSKSSACVFCGKFLKLSSLRRHMAVHKREKSRECDQCGRVFAQKGHLMQHLLTHTGEKPFVCAECGKTFSRQVNLTTHLRVHSGEKPYKCPECGRGFSQKWDMMKHSRMHSGEKPFECPECRKAFTKKSNMMKHFRLHCRKNPTTALDTGEGSREESV